MDLIHLRSFAEVAERGTVAAAAESLGYTPPAVSQHLAKLEADLGTSLFDRIGRRLRLSGAGVTLLPVALEMMELERHGRTTVREPAPRPCGRIAGFASALTNLVVPHLPALRANAHITLTETEDAGGLRELRLGALDIVLVQEYDGQPVNRDASMVYTPLATDQLRLVMPPQMAASIHVDQLGDTDWLLNGDGTRCSLATIALLRTAGIDPPISANVADNTALLELVAAGHGVTIVPEMLLTGSPDVTVGAQHLGVSRTIFAAHLASTQATLAPLIQQLASRPEDS